MLNSGKKIRALLDPKKKIQTLVLGEKNLNETKNHNPPFKLNGRPLRSNERGTCFSSPKELLIWFVIKQHLLS
jgi:hypothetical protein